MLNTIYVILVKFSAVLIAASTIAVIVCCSISVKNDRVNKRILPWFVAAFVASIVVVLLIALTFTQVMWHQFRAMPIDEATHVSITYDNITVKHSAAVARSIHNAIAVALRIPAHHSHPLDGFMVVFTCDEVGTFSYLVSPDSEQKDAYWLSYLPDRDDMDSKVDVGQFVSKSLAGLLREGIEDSAADFDH